MSTPHVYAWARARGFFGRRTDCPVSHLLFDGGVLSVPPSAAFEFVHEYARGVVRGGPKPCVVEVRTPVFRFFYDLDARAAPDVAGRISRGDFPDDVANFLRSIVAATEGLFAAPPGRAVVCVADAPKPLDDGAAKVGIHVTFDDLYATSASARYVRERVLAVLDGLRGEPNPFVNDLRDVVDEAVYKGSGLRLPWSAKKNDARAYVPVGELLASTWTPLDPAALARSVTAARDLVARASLRTTTAGATRLRDTPDGEAPHGYAPADLPTSTMAHASLREFAGVLPRVEALIPPEYRGRVTGVLRGDHAVLFRHSSRYCANVGREHHTSNTYFVLTRDGLRQCCYSRKNVDDATSCRDFRGELIPVPEDVSRECLPPPPPPPPTVAPMPSARATSVTSVLTRGIAKKSKKTRAAPAASAGSLNPFAMVRGT